MLDEKRREVEAAAIEDAELRKRTAALQAQLDEVRMRESERENLRSEKLCQNTPVKSKSIVADSGEENHENLQAKLLVVEEEAKRLRVEKTLLEEEIDTLKKIHEKEQEMWASDAKARVRIAGVMDGAEGGAHADIKP